MKREKLLELSETVPENVRLTEASEGSSLNRKMLKLKKFGPRYIHWALANYAWRVPKEVTFPLFWGRRVRLPFSMNADFVTLYLTGAIGGSEYKLMRYLIRTLNPEDIFYDVGAHYGFYTYLAKELVTTGEVHSFEPMPDIFRYLRLNSAGSGHINNAALSDEAGETTLFIHGLSAVFSTINKEVCLFDPPRDSRRIQVQCTTLDEYIGTHKAPTVLKIDVEGAEDKILNGGSKLFSLSHPTVAMEIWGGEAGRRFSLPAAQHLIAFGYRSYLLEDDGRTRGPLSTAQIEESFRKTEFWDNLIFEKS